MALPTCPACKQSVLDDDAEVCPFCGANMKGKPGQAKPAPAAAKAPTRSPATPASTAAKPNPGTAVPATTKPVAAKPVAAATTSAPKPASPATPPAGDHDDPFAIVHDTSKAIPISLKQTGRFTEPIVCPMCETAGFIPPQARGRDVKCANPKCIAPVFMAPKNLQPPQAMRQAPPPPKKINTTLIASIAAAVLLIAGGATYWLLFMQPKPKVTPAPAVVGAAPAPEIVPITEDIVGGVHKPKAPEEKEHTIQQALDGISALALRSENIRDKALGCRLATFAFALVGDEKKAEDFLAQLKGVAAGTPHYQIEPLIQLAWLKLAQNKKPDAVTFVNQAHELAPRIPSQGRDSSDLVIQLAAGLAAIGELDKAHNLLDQHILATGAGHLSASESIARDIGTYDIDLWLPGSMIGGWDSPQRVAATIKLVCRHLPAEARQLAVKSKSLRSRLESAIGFVDAVILIGGPTEGLAAAEEIRKELSTLPPPAQALLDIHTATGLIRLGKQDAATPFITRAQATLAALPVPASLDFKDGDYKAFLEQKTPDFEPLEVQALAAGEFAVLQRRLGNPTEALKWGHTSLAILRAAGFSLERLRNTEAQIASQGSARFQQALKSLFRLGSLDEARRKSSEVNRQITAWKAIAERRQMLQLLVLWELIDQKLATQLKQDVEQLSKSESLSDRENFLRSALMARLEAPVIETPQQPLSPFMAHSSKTIFSQYLWTRRQEIHAAFRDKQLDQAISLIAGIASNEDSDYWITRLMNRLLREQSGPSAAKAVQKLPPSDLKERLARLLSAQAVTLGQGAIVWEVADASSTPITIRLNTQTGIVEGLHSHPPAKATQK